MIYDSQSGALYAADGTFLKTVYCPMAIRLSELKPLSNESPDRTCHACGDTVHSLDDLTDEQATQLLKSKPDACVFATQAATHIVFLKPIGQPTSAPYGCVHVKTARNLETMDDAQKRGYTLVFKNTGVLNEFGGFKFQLMQHVKTGELQWTGDYRDMSSGSPEWRLIRSFTNVRPDRPFPLAAYLIPKGLPAGTRVYIEDLIQDVTVVTWNQGNAIRMTSATGTWNGEDIDIDEPEEDYSPMLLG